MTADKVTGKRGLKRLRLAAAVERAEKDRQQHEVTGLVWAGVTKAALQKQAGVGKNYIDMLDPADELANRIKPLLRRAETMRGKRDVEKTRLERNRELERQLTLQARENQELMSQLNRTRSELDRVNQRLSLYERHYYAENRAKPGLTLVESDRSADVIAFTQDEPDGA